MDIQPLNEDFCPAPVFCLSLPLSCRPTLCGKERIEPGKEYHIYREDQDTGRQIKEWNGDPFVEYFQEKIAFRLNREEIVRIRIQAGPPHEHIDHTDAEQDEKGSEQCGKDVAERWPVKIKSGHCQPFDQDHEMSAEKTEHSRKKNGAVLEFLSRHDQRHQRAERGREEAECLQRSDPEEYGEGNEQHVDVAEMQRKLAQPVEFAHTFGRPDKAVISIDGEKVFIDKETHGRRGAHNGKNDTSGHVTLFSKSEREYSEDTKRKDKQSKEQRVARFQDPFIPA